MPLRNAVLAATLLLAVSISRADEVGPKGDFDLTAEVLIHQCGPALNEQITARRTAYEAAIKDQTGPRTSPYVIDLARADGSLTLIAHENLREFLEGSTQPRTTRFAEKCRVVAASPRGWAALGYIQARLKLSDSLNNMRKLRDGLGSFGVKMPEKPGQHCTDESRLSAIADALAFKRILFPDAGPEPLVGRDLLPFARSNDLHCD